MMKNFILKRVLTLFLSLAMLTTMFMLPSSAALPETTVQKWDFAGFTYGIYPGAEYSDLTNADESVSIGGHSYWEGSVCGIVKTIDENGYTYEKEKTFDFNRPWYVIALKLNKDIQAGVTMNLVTDIKFTGSCPSKMHIYYNQSKDISVDRETALATTDTTSVVLYSKEDETNLTADTDKVFSFVSDTDLPAGGYLHFRCIPVEAGAVGTVSNFELTAETPYAVDEETAAFDEWDFTKLADSSYVHGTQYGPLVSSDERISLGVSNPYWNQFADTIISNGIITQTNTTYSGNRIEFVLNLKLDMDLKAGKKYTFATDLDYTHSTGEWLMPNFYYTSTIHNSDDANNNLAIPDGATIFYQATSTTTVGEINDFTYTFTPKIDLAAGGYLNFRVKMKSRTGTFSISNAKITSAIPTTTLKHYDFTTEEDRACIVGDTTNQVSVIETATVGGNSEYAGKTALNWKNSMLALKDFTFESDKYYKFTIVYATYGAKSLNLFKYDLDPETNELTGNSWRTDGIVNLPGTGAIGTFTEQSFDFYSRTDIDYENGQVPVFYHSANANFIIVSLTISEYSTKVTALKADAPSAPTDNNRLYTKIVLPSINTALQQYAMVDTEGNYTAITGNTVTGLDYDTEYKFVVKYIASYKYLESDYSDAVTVKTRKRGDVTGDEKVNIVDLVRIKKGLTEEPENPVYDIEPEGGKAGSLVYMKRIILGLIK